MMASGEAEFCLQDDWAIGTLNAAGFECGEDCLCAGAPTASGEPGYVLNSNSIVTWLAPARRRGFARVHSRSEHQSYVHRAGVHRLRWLDVGRGLAQGGISRGHHSA